MAAWFRILCVSWLLSVPVVSAQVVRARIELTSGRSFVAEVVRIEPESFVLRFADRELVIAADDVATLVPLSGEDARAGRREDGPAPWESLDEDSAGADAARTDAGGSQASGTKATARPTADGIGEVTGAGADPRAASKPSRMATGPAGAGGDRSREQRAPLGPDAHVVDLLERYLWIVPGGAGHLTSIGAGLLLLMSWLLMAAGRAVGLERIGFARCLGLSVAMLAVLVIEASVLPVQPLVVGLALLLDVGVFVVLAAMLLGARLGQATFVVAAFVFFSILLVMLSELAGVLLSARDLMGDVQSANDSPPAPSGR